MSGDVLDAPMSRPAPPAPDRDDTAEKSYLSLRLAIIGLLLAVAVAVVRQSVDQGFLLTSVSAYYYTPAQAIFVGGLVGLAACMIALKGTTVAEDVLLNLGGMFAAVVAVVPTARGADYRTALRACRESATPLLTDKASAAGPDCPTVRALEAATRANVDNNMVALLAVGFLALGATLVLARVRRRNGRPEATGWPFWTGFAAAAAVWAGALVAVGRALDWFVDNAHYLAAGGLGLCIIAVAVENGRRRQDRSDAGGFVEHTRDRVGALVSPRQNDRYVWIARVMIVVAGVAVVLWLVHATSLFWLEITVSGLFVVLWVVQTVELAPRPADR